MGPVSHRCARRRTERFMAGLVGWGSLAVAFASRASCETAPPQAVPKPEVARTAESGSAQPFSEARRQLEAAQALEREQSLRTPGLNKPASPELLVIPPAGTTAPAPRPEPSSFGQKPLSGQWLLEGVLRETLREQSRVGAQKRATGFLAPRDEMASPDSEEGKRPSARSEPLPGRLASEEGQGGERSSRDLPEAAGFANPLAGFLKDWMTAKDYALLAPRISEGAPERAPAQPERPREAELLGTGAALSAFSSSRTRSAAPLAENPFLNALEAGLKTPVPEAPSAQLAPVPVAVPSFEPSSSKSSMASEKRERTEASERLLKEDDKKYFPQLNRF